LSPENETWTLRLLPYRDALVGDAGRALWILLGAVTLVLLIACGNVASLLLARATTRNGEVAVRAALGASRSRIVRQLLTESMILGIAGGAAGFLLALLLVRGVRLLAAGFLPRFSEVVIDPVVLLFTIGISLATGLLFGLAPALHSVRSGTVSTLQAIGRTSGTRVSLRARDALVVAQIAISLTLVVGAGLLARTLLRLQNVDPGFDSDGVMAAEVQLAGERYATRESQARFWSELLTRTRALPGVVDASATTLLPLVGGNDTYYWIEGNPPASDAERRNAEISVVADRYFETMDIPLLRGRAFRENEASGPNAIIVNAALAARLFPDSDPIGKRLVIDFGQPFTAEIVGIVGDVLAFGLTSGPPDMMYFAYDQLGGFGIGFLNLVVRAGEEPLDVVPAVRAALGEMDADIPLSDTRTMNSIVGSTVATQRFGARLLVAFAIVALALAVIGLYGVLGYVVAQRTRELGVRVALGAGRTQIFTIVVRRGMLIVLFGLGFGIAGALSASHLLQSLLFDVSARDPVVFAAGPVVLLVAGFLACALPAIRASRVDPVRALRGG
jgi:putative ABC transport system permease protein